MGGGEVRVRFAGDLDRLARGAERRVGVDAPRSVKDLVESLGVPHTEVGRLRVDGAEVGFAELLRGGEAVDVEPAALGMPLTPEDPPRRFVADVHLGRLAQLLRLAGFDTDYRNDRDDDELVRVALDEGRVVLTRDRGVLKRGAVVHGHLLRSTDPQEQLVEVVRRFRLAGRMTPFTRCLRCNGRLRPVDEAVVAHRLEPGTRREHRRFVRCDGCGQVYWPGSHHERLRELVAHVHHTATRPT